ncbi:MAG: PilZ domain-containing protein [Candidatus Omnitrophota bacterium]
MNWNGIDRRRFVRVKLPCEIIITLPIEHIISSHTEDISAGGLRVLLEEKILSGSEVDLDIYGIKDAPLICRGRVAWVFERKRTLAKRIFDTGIEFCAIQENDVQAIQEFVSTATKKK